MPRITKKKLKEINFISVIHEVLAKYDHSCIESAPEMWYSEEKTQYDIASEVEAAVKDEVLKILNK